MSTLGIVICVIVFIALLASCRKPDADANLNAKETKADKLLKDKKFTGTVTIFNILAVVVLIAAMLAGGYANNISSSAMITFIISGILLAAIFYGIAEIIKRLDTIINNNNNNDKEV